MLVLITILDTWPHWHWKTLSGMKTSRFWSRHSSGCFTTLYCSVLIFRAMLGPCQDNFRSIGQNLGAMLSLWKFSVAPMSDLHLVASPGLQEHGKTHRIRAKMFRAKLKKLTVVPICSGSCLHQKGATNYRFFPECVAKGSCFLSWGLAVDWLLVVFVFFL